MALKNGFAKCSLFALSASGWKDLSLFVFPPKKTLIRGRHCAIGQSRCSMTSKQSIGWFLESSRAWSFFTRACAQPTKSHARLYPFDKPIKLLYFRSFVVSVLFALFHFKVTGKSRYTISTILTKATERKYILAFADLSNIFLIQSHRRVTFGM